MQRGPLAQNAKQQPYMSIWGVLYGLLYKHIFVVCLLCIELQLGQKNCTRASTPAWLQSYADPFPSLLAYTSHAQHALLPSHLLP